MRYLSLIICILLIFVNAFGQVSNRRERAISFETTLDATDTDMITISNAQNTGKGTYTTIVWVDSLDGASDSLLIEYRRSWYPVALTDTLFLGPDGGFGLNAAGSAEGDTITGANLWTYTAYAITGGSAQSWKTLQVYGGPAGSLDDFDNDFDWEHGRRYECIFDFDGYNWRYLQVRVTKTANDSTVGNADSCRVHFQIDID